MVALFYDDGSIQLRRGYPQPHPGVMPHMMHVHPSPQPVAPAPNSSPEPRKPKVDQLLSLCDRMKKGDQETSLATIIQDTFKHLDEAVQEFVAQSVPQHTYEYGAHPPPPGAWVHG